MVLDGCRRGDGDGDVDGRTGGGDGLLARGAGDGDGGGGRGAGDGDGVCFGSTRGRVTSRSAGFGDGRGC